MIFMLLVKNKQDQMPLLSGLMSRFSDAGLMDRLSQEEGSRSDRQAAGYLHRQSLTIDKESRYVSHYKRNSVHH